MSALLPFIKDQPVFEPEAIHAMSVAYEDICRSLKVDGNETARETIAIRVIELARRGERDPAVLRDRVLKEAGAGSRSD